MVSIDDPLPDQTDPKLKQPSDKTVLVVDDDYEIVETLKFALRSNGYSVITARNGNEALAMAETKNPDVMVLDLMMPKRSGFLVLEHLRQTGDSPLPVIVITANEGSRHREYVEVLGVREYFCKPIAIESLLECVDRLTSA